MLSNVMTTPPDGETNGKDDGLLPYVVIYVHFYHYNVIRKEKIIGNVIFDVATYVCIYGYVCNMLIHLYRIATW